MNPRIRVAIISSLFVTLFTVPCMAQNFGSSVRSEKYPTTRDPSYVPPLFPEGMQGGSESSQAILLFSTGGEGLADYIKNRKKTEIEQKRKNNRYVERETERMLERGLYKNLLEKEVMSQMGAEGFPADAGSYPYKETMSRRYSIVFLLALPITAGFSFGAIRVGKASSGDSGGFTHNESIAGGLLTVILALSVATYDHYRVTELLNSQDPTKDWPIELRKKEGLRPDDLSQVWRYDAQHGMSRDHPAHKNDFSQNLLQFSFQF